MAYIKLFLPILLSSLIAIFFLMFKLEKIKNRQLQEKNKDLRESQEKQIKRNEVVKETIDKLDNLEYEKADIDEIEYLIRIWNEKRK